jgi:tetratricopeptide (TPR) repeat protein
MVTGAELPQLLKLDPTIPRDLATIVHKAIARDPSDRYPTAGELAADLTRFLEDRPIKARRLSPVGVAWRWAKRNPAVASLMGLVVALLVGIAAGSMIAADQYRAVAKRANQASQVADARAQEATRARSESDANAARANAARAEADQSAAESKAVVAFVTNDVLGAAAPSKTRGKAVTVLEALANAEKALEGKVAKEPLVEASVRESLANIYTELGEYEKAGGHAARSLALREKVLGPEHEATLSAMHCLGWSYYTLGPRDKHEQGEALYRRMLETCRRTRKDDDDLTLRAMGGLAAILTRVDKLDEAATLHQRIVDVCRRTKGPEDPETLNAMHNLTVSLRGIGKLKEAELLLREVVQAEIKNEPDHPRTLNALNNYTALLDRLGRHEELADWTIRSMESHLRVLKLKHPSTRNAIWNALYSKIELLKFQEALEIADRSLEQARREFGPDDASTLAFLDERAGVLYHMGDLVTAGSSAEEVLACRTSKLGPEDPQTLDALKFLAVIRRQQGAAEEAKTLLSRLHDDAQRALDSGAKKRIDPDQALELRRKIAFADLVKRNLGRPERSEFAPGTPGGPPRIDAPYRAVSPVADGRIEPREYGDGEGFAFDFADDRNPGRMAVEKKLIRTIKEPSDLSAWMHAAHTSTALFLAFRVRDQSVRADPVAARAPWLNDCVEVFLDGDRVPNDHKVKLVDGQGNAEGFQLMADVLGNRWSNLRPLGTTPFAVGTSRTDDGYIIEFEIPLSQIDTQDGPGFRAAMTGAELWINVSIDDVDDAVIDKTASWVVWSEDPLESPTLGGEDYWPVALRLVPAPAPGR